MKYDYNTLVDFCKENNIILSDDYSNAKSINSFAVIEGKCINNNCDFNFKGVNLSCQSGRCLCPAGTNWFWST
jgi:hypothetical protein